MDDQRMLFKLAVLPEGTQIENQKLREMYYKLNDSLNSTKSFPNIESFYSHCEGNYREMGSYLQHACNSLKLDSDYCNDHSVGQKLNSSLSSSERKKIRVLLFIGDQKEIADLRIDEATHNMILQSCNSSYAFFSAKKHKNTPNFYQSCSSAENALCYVEALIADACMCHYYGVSDAALKHDDKQKISSEKIEFLREVVQNQDFVNTVGKSNYQLLSFVLNKIDNNAPYISFFSIFTLGSQDFIENLEKQIAVCDDSGKKDQLIKTREHFSTKEEKSVFDKETIFHAYCIVWLYFQQWYYRKHGKHFSENTEFDDPVATICNRSVYQGQISSEGAIARLKEKINEHKSKDSSDFLFGYYNRYALVLIRNMPYDSNQRRIFEVLFGERLHQAKWDIIHWSELEKYEKIINFLEIIPLYIE